MITSQDRYIGIHKLEETFKFVNNDKRTKITSSDIAQFIDEYHAEMFEDIASDWRAYAHFDYLMEVGQYYSFEELAQDWLADYDTMSAYNPNTALSNNHGYDTIDEMERDYLIICDSAIDGFLVFG